MRFQSSRRSLHHAILKPTVIGDPVSLTVRDTTPLDVNGSGIGIDGNGWVAEIVFKGLPIGGTFDASKVVLTVNDPGYDSTGAAIMRTRTIVGGKVLRRQYPNVASNQISKTGNDLLVRFTLRDRVFFASTIIGVSIGAGAYTGSNSSASAIFTNNSTRAYPKPVFGWLNAPYLRVTSSTLNVEAIAGHAAGMSGQMVACIKYTATDGTNISAELTSGLTSISALVTKGQPPEAYKAALDISGLTNGADCTVNAKVYPWIGNSSAILNLSTDGVALPTGSVQSLLPFVCDRTGAYGGAIAYVRASAVGGTVSLTDATARAAPFPTIGAAFTALQTFNNANRGHNNHSGSTIFLMDDGASGAVQHVMTGSSANSGTCWTDVKPDLSAVGAVSLTSTGNVFIPDCVRFTGGLTLNCPNQVNFVLGPSSGTGARFMFDNTTIVYSSSSNKPANFIRRIYWRNTTFSSIPSGIGTLNSGQDNVSWIGCVADNRGFAAFGVAKTTIGCSFKNFYPVEITITATFDSNDGGLIVNNKWTSMTVGALIGYNQAFTRGLGLWQNLFEGVTASGGSLMNISADSAILPFDNLVEAHNLTAGDRGNRLYNDAAGSQVAPSGVLKRGTQMYCIVDNWNCKSDAIATGTGSVGNWEFSHNVGNKGNVSRYGSRQGAAPAVSQYYLGDYWAPDSEYNATLNATDVTFTTDNSKSINNAAPGTGEGDYHLTGGSNVAYSRVAAGQAVLSFDLDGTARKNNGAGAAGPYEH